MSQPILNFVDRPILCVYSNAVCARVRILAMLAWLGLSFVVRADEPSATSWQFNRDIRPILSEACFRCHGPDSAARQADLRLDREAELFAQRAAGTPVERGAPEKSQIWQRITSPDRDEVMPPPTERRQLTEEEKNRLRAWIAQGAKWEPHWSFIPPRRSIPLVVKNEGWIRNSIDRFVLASLEQAGLAPSPDASRNELVRRVTLDLTGLPPSPDEVESFAGDDDPEAYERLVNRLLKSSAYGEHRARYWLDAARYADTHGLHIDNYREMWPYRDWVIGAFNRNLPFDQFTREQLAGDLLPDRSESQVIATGFHRCNMTTSEGGSILEEVATNYTRDRVETTAVVWLGLTAGCAVCHDHKYDPLTQKEFYQLAAFFNNFEQRVLDGNVPDTPPILVIPPSGDRARWHELSALHAQVQQQRSQQLDRLTATLAQRLQTGSRLVDLVDDRALHLSLPLANDDSRIQGALEGQPRSWDLPDGMQWCVGPGLDRALQFARPSELEIHDAANFETSEPFTISFWMQSPPEGGKLTVLSRFDPTAPPDQPRHGWIFELIEKVPVFRLIGNGGDDELTYRGYISDPFTLKPGEWHHLAFTYDGRGDYFGIRYYLDGVEVPREDVAGRQNGPLEGTLRGGGPLRIGGAGQQFFEHGALQRLRIDRRELLDSEIRCLAQQENLRRRLAAGEVPSALEERRILAEALGERMDSQFRELSERLHVVRAAQLDIRRRSVVTHVLEERSGMEPGAHVLYRGQYDQRREQVRPDVPASLPSLHEDAPRNRLGLARWLVAAENPLVARVTVNRFWEQVFGRGLVRTSDDFGVMGESPSHPELLDWLAVEFRDSGWDVKRLLKLIVSSATYRQTAQSPPQRRALDPDNRLLSRGPRFRMDAEMLRDFALKSSGVLVQRVGGPSVKPYQPPGIWEAVAMEISNTRQYRPDAGEGLYRRSLYTFWKRSAPPAALNVFDAPTREICTVRRERTNTPLQALATMNDVQWIEAARRLAERVERAQPGHFQGKLDQAALAILARRPSDAEREVLRSAHAAYQQRFQSSPESARQLVRFGSSPADVTLNAVDTATWTLIVNQLMNLDEALCK